MGEGEPTNWLWRPISLMWPERLARSAWFEHLPFAFWIVEAASPHILVELGTHFGTSYAGFLQAVQQLGLATQCYAVDTWEGDPQTGAYGDDVYNDFRIYHDRRYGSFSALLRTTFDEACEQFSDGSIDLLHIDGCHTYDAVKHDYEHWLPKLSRRGVILFHDVAVRDGDFGVWRLWEEICGRYPSFAFPHGSGLGVLAVGEELSPAIRRLVETGAQPGEAAASVKGFFAALGRRISERAELETVASRLAQANAEVTRLGEEVKALSLRLEQRDAEQAISRLSSETRVQKQLISRLGSELAVRTTAVANLEQELSACKAESARAAAAREAELAAIWSSTSWRLSAPVRWAGQRARRILHPGRAPAEPYRQVAAPRLLARRRLPDGAAKAADPGVAPLRRGSVRSPTTPRSLVWISGEPDTPGHDYRVLRLAAAAAAAGLRAGWLRPEEIPARTGEIAKADVLIIWRAAWDERIAAAIETARGNGVKIVFDIDDLMLDPELARRDVIDGIRTMNLTEQQVSEYYTRMQTTMSTADLCVATTAELAGYMRRAGKPAVVIANGFDERIRAASRLAVRRRAAAADDGLLRIGYAAGTRTHQRDFAVCADAIAEVLRARPECRLVLFRSAAHRLNCLDLEEFPALSGLEDRIEWRDMVPVDRLPEELARLDVNLAPLEVGNPFCEAKSELKFFEAALVDVPTIASPTGPFRRAVRHGETGFFAASREEWREVLDRLLDDRALRRRVAAAARREALWRFGPERRTHLLLRLLDFLDGGRSAAQGFAAEMRDRSAPPLEAPIIPEHRVLFQADRLGTAVATVVVPLYNYGHTVEEALESVRRQSLEPLDLVVVDDHSQDNSAEVAVAWAREHAARFNRIVVARNAGNEGLGATRNVGFELAETPWVFPLDADNRLVEGCAAACLRAIEGTAAAFAYPHIRYFGDGERQIEIFDWDPMRLANGNYIDAMALISRAAWAAAGGYDTVRSGWEDFDLWCRFSELGLWGVAVPPPPLAEYRLHGRSMIKEAMAQPERVHWMMRHLTQRHPWLTMVSPVPAERTLPAPDSPGLSAAFAAYQEIDVIGRPQQLGELDEPAYLLANPDVRASGVPAWQHFAEHGLAEGREQWQGAAAIAYLREHKLSTVAFKCMPMTARKFGEPAYFISHESIRELQIPTDTAPISSNVYTTDIVDLIRANPDKRFLDVGAGLRPTYYRNVMTTEIYDAVTTDVVCIGEDLPFADDQFDYVFAFAVLEHTRRPWDVAKEMCRVVKPGGKIIVDYPFLQPVHGYPHHFFNATATGNASLFEEWCDILSLTVPLHLWPIYALSWMLTLWKEGLPAEEADAFRQMTVEQLIAPPHEQSGRPYCEKLSEDKRQTIAAGSRLVAMKKGRLH